MDKFLKPKKSEQNIQLNDDPRRTQASITNFISKINKTDLQKEKLPIFFKNESNIFRDKQININILSLDRSELFKLLIQH